MTFDIAEIQLIAEEITTANMKLLVSTVCNIVIEDSNRLVPL